jgi:hypothetical protein
MLWVLPKNGREGAIILDCCGFASAADCKREANPCIASAVFATADVGRRFSRAFAAIFAAFSLKFLALPADASCKICKPY